MKNRESPPAKPSIEEAPKLELKSLPTHLEYELTGKGNTLPVIISSDLNEQQVESLLKVQKRFKRAMGGLLQTLLGSLMIFFLIKSNSCPIISQVLSTRDD